MKKYLSKILTGVVLTSLAALSAKAEFSWSDYYEITSIPAPKGVDYQIGGLDLNAEGDLVACFHRGEVMTYSEEAEEWKLFASGLHEPLGIYVEDEGTILVIQRGELTRLHDTNKDGKADFYELVSNDWGLSGNYHEFTFGLVKDSKKNIYISLGTASNGAGVAEEIRGEWSLAGGLSQEDFIADKEKGGWSVQKKKVARMYARVPYRGCVLKISPDSKKAELYATGLRTPNGLYMDENDQLWVSDNQGDWVGASKIHRIQEGGFHGHPASLLWDNNPPEVTPADLPVAELDKRRVKEPILLPQGECANSITQVHAFKDSFGPFSTKDASIDQLIVGEMNHARIVRYLPDIVNGTHQGTGTHMLVSNELGSGNNRLVYSPDGKSIFFGKTHLSWPGREGIKKATYNGKPYLMAESVKLTPTGFKFTFNSPIEASNAADNYKVESYYIAYHSSYGSKKNDLTEEVCSNISVDGNTLTIELKDKPRENRVYGITLPSEITSENGALSYNQFWYTAHSVLK